MNQWRSSLLTHICVSLRLNVLIHCWIIVNWIPRDKHLWSLIQHILFQENSFRFSAKCWQFRSSLNVLVKSSKKYLLSSKQEHSSQQFGSRSSAGSRSITINSSSPGDAYMRQWTQSSIVTMSTAQSQATIWTNADLLSIELLRTTSEILIIIW